MSGDTQTNISAIINIESLLEYVLIMYLTLLFKNERAHSALQSIY